eukprot:CAMPEP_0113496492 /NCGR_PEP_ID=MMETSP0014_2-20120614/30149_1 /TAXON_ID=2857 /ORGANISM="Nitzschia sp." /LENGTH=387 /DNA_ID=CAMNT_0000390415 /DNA_START=140 /DNA_END=1303 /DNA_ORIENTATION=- /assembly_acc=CAM_ASM_000159
MCISNNRRPYPTNGFKNRGGAIVPPTLSGAVSLKDAIARSSQSTVPLKATNQKNSCGAADHIGSKNQHIVVQHKHYVDHANDNRSDYKEDLPARGGVTVPFPIRLHEMLDAVERDGYGHIISWAPHGRCVIIHKPKEFVEILPTYFKLSKLASFQRQLNLYGFQRLTRGRDRGGYYNELFLRGRVYLAHAIQRQKVKGTGVRARSNPDQEPDFWAMPFVEQSTAAPVSCPSQQQSSSSCAAAAAPVAPRMAQHDLQGLQNALYSFNPMMNFQRQQQTPRVVSSSNSANDDLCLGFGGKHFHILEPINGAPPAARPVPSMVMMPTGQQQFPSPPTWSADAVEDIVDDILGKDMDEFFDDFEFPEENILQDTNLEDDDVFGDLLDQMIA